jgi:ATP-dependent Clp protease ATP-binding subunit ClpX
MEGVEIDFREDGCAPWPSEPWSARPVRGACAPSWRVLLDSMYNIPSQPDVAKIVIDESVIKGDSEPLLVYESQESAPDKAGTEE